MSTPELPLDPFSDRLLTADEVASLFKVGPKTVQRWAKMDKIEYIRTPGGHVRFRESNVRKALLGHLTEWERSQGDATS